MSPKMQVDGQTFDGADDVIRYLVAEPLDVERLAVALHEARYETCARPEGGPDDWDCQGVAADILARLSGSTPSWGSEHG